MTTQTLGDKKDFILSSVRNGETSATITKGSPCILKMNGTEDGFSVVLPSSSTAAKIAQFFYGVATDDILAGQIGKVQRDGVCNFIKLELQTRANTSAGSSFSTADTLLLGALLGIDSAGNCFKTIASTVAAPSGADQTFFSFQSGDRCSWTEHQFSGWNCDVNFRNSPHCYNQCEGDVALDVIFLLTGAIKTSVASYFITLLKRLKGLNANNGSG